MNDQDRQEWHRLFSAALDDQLSEAEGTRLNEVLKSSPEARKLWFLYHDNECSLAELKSPAARALPMSRTATSTTTTTNAEAEATPWWSRLRPLTGLAAGLIIGSVSAQALYSAVDYSLRRALIILEESFESGPPPRVTGVSLEPGIWSGDFTEVVADRADLHPETGGKFLRFVRADYEGKAHAQGSYTGDLYRVIDLRAYRSEFVDGGAVAQVTAGFNSLPFPDTERYGASIEAYALGSAALASMADLSEAMETRNGSMAMSQKHLRCLDRDPRTWERMGVELRLPSEAEFLLIRLSVIHGKLNQRREIFDGQFLDDVQITVVRRDPLR